MTPADKTDKHHDAIKHIDDYMERLGTKFQPVDFLQPLWKIAGETPLDALADTLIERRYTQDEVSAKSYALRELLPIIGERQPIGLGYNAQYTAWRHDNLRIVWPSYRINALMRTDPKFATRIVLSGVFASGWLFPVDGGVNLYREPILSANSQLVFSLPADHLMTLWVRTVLAYDKFIHELTKCMVRAVATTYGDLAIRGKDFGPDSMLRFFYLRMVQLCETVNPTWARIHPAVNLSGRSITTIKGASQAAKLLHSDDEKLLRQALDQCMMINAATSPELEPEFEHFHD